MSLVRPLQQIMKASSGPADASLILAVGQIFDQILIKTYRAIFLEVTTIREFWRHNSVEEKEIMLL